MVIRPAWCVAGSVIAGVIGGCSTPFDAPRDLPRTSVRTIPEDSDPTARSVFRKTGEDDASPEVVLNADSGVDEYVRYALYHSPEVEAAYQRWRAAAERIPQVGALPDPRLVYAHALREVETRTGPQEARVGVEQTLPWPGKLRDREDAASRGARRAWRTFEAARLRVSERVIAGLHELAYLDRAIEIARENVEILRSFEQVLRARYRVGSGSHPELVRAQVELGQVEDRLRRLEAMRPVFVAALNAALNRPSDAEVPSPVRVEGHVASVGSEELLGMARARNPELLALDEEVERQRRLGAAAEKDGLPDLTLGLDYVFTGDAVDPTTPGSGDDPVLIRFGINLPVWREKYDAGVREAIARRLAAAGERLDRANQIEADIERAWFEHTDADRRVRLYERTLIPKAEESLRASLAGFRAGELGFLDLLDTERTLLEFAVAAERARADRGKALARLGTLAGGAIPTHPADDTNRASPETPTQSEVDR